MFLNVNFISYSLSATAAGNVVVAGTGTSTSLVNNVNLAVGEIEANCGADDGGTIGKGGVVGGAGRPSPSQVGGNIGAEGLL